MYQHNKFSLLSPFWCASFFLAGDWVTAGGTPEDAVVGAGAVAVVYFLFFIGKVDDDVID